MERYASAAEELKEALNERGIQLYILITPNKEEIYGDLYLPDKVTVLDEMSKTDQLISYLAENTDVTVIYPKERLLEYRDQDIQVWRKYDTHWNNIGAFIVSQEILAAIGKPSIGLNDVAIVEAGNCGGDLANMLGLTNIYNDDITYLIEGYCEEIHAEQAENVPQPNLNYSKYVSDTSTDESILCIGDSFLGAMEPFIAANFSTAMFVHRDNYGALERDLFEEEHPDIVVFQTAERFVEYLDESMLRYAQGYLQP